MNENLEPLFIEVTAGEKNCMYFQEDSTPAHHRKFSTGAVVCIDEQITFTATFPSSEYV
jgi:hypothetical protein